MPVDTPRLDPYVRHSRIRLLPQMHDVKTHARKRMQDALGGNPALDKRLETPPVHAGLLTAQAELPPPKPDDPLPEGAQDGHVAWHCLGR